MIYQLFITGLLVIINSFSFSALADAEKTVKDMEQERNYHRRLFLNYMNSTKMCEEQSQDLLSQILVIKSKIPETKQQCDTSSMDTSEKYQKCTHALSQLSSMINHLGHNIANANVKFQEDCPQFAPAITIEMSRLSHTMGRLGYRHDYLSDQHELGLYGQNVNQDIYKNQSKTFYCETDMRNIIRIISALDFNIFLRAFLSDIYYFNKTLSTIRVFNDQFRETARLCAVDDPEFLEKEKRIEKTLLELENNELNKISFEEAANQSCKWLEEEAVETSLCENPVNTPSWKYSIHKILEASYQTALKELSSKQ